MTFYLKITNEGVASLAVVLPICNWCTVRIVLLPRDLLETSDEATLLAAACDLYITDLSITQYDKLGITLAHPSMVASNITHQSEAVRDGRNFVVTLDAADVNDDAAFMMVQLPAGAFQHAAPADVRAAHFDADNALKSNTKSGILRLELVKAEPGGMAIQKWFLL